MKHLQIRICMSGRLLFVPSGNFTVSPLQEVVIGVDLHLGACSDGSEALPLLERTR